MRDIITEYINALKNDGDLQSILGGPYVYAAYIPQPPVVPSITIKRNSETAQPRLGQSLYGYLDYKPMCEVHVWCSTNTLDIDDIAARVVSLTFQSSFIPGTREWRLVSGPAIQWEEDRQLYHLSMRFQCVYTDC